MNNITGPITNDTINQIGNLKNVTNVSLELSSKIVNITDQQLKMAIEGKIPPDTGVLKLVDTAFNLQLKQYILINL
jgi:hypothetical protein